MTQPEAVICTSGSKPQVPSKHRNSLVGRVPSRTRSRPPLRGGPNGRNGTAGFCRVSTKMQTQTQGNGWFPTAVLHASRTRGFNLCWQITVRFRNVQSTEWGTERRHRAEIVQNPNALNAMRNRLQDSGRRSVGETSDAQTGCSHRRRQDGGEQTQANKNRHAAD
jgi:hypothetical protein